MIDIVKRLSQATIEDKYAKNHNKERILKDISNLVYKIDQLTASITEYANQEYYDSKTIRLATVRSLEPREVALEVISAVITIQGKQPIQGISGSLSGYFKYDDPIDGIKTAAECIALASKLDICNIIPARDSEIGSMLVESNYSLDRETLDAIELTKFLPPMICEPDEITHNHQSGYLTFDECVVLGDYTGHNMPIRLDVINIMNRIPLELEERMLEFPEESTKPLDTPEKKENFERMARTSKVVYQEILDEGNVFWFNNKPDSRGRIYTVGYHINIQGSKYKRSLINFHKKEVIK